MNDDIKDIAMRIRDLRDIANISQESLAKELNIDVETYEQYESGQTDIPIGIIKKIAEKFKVEFITLITGQEPHLNRYSVVRKGKGVAVERRKEYDYQDIAYGFTNKKTRCTIKPLEPQARNLKRRAEDGYQNRSGKKLY